jgi:anti-sigma factor RsiW
MDCAQSQEWIHGYVDGELEGERRLELERHLANCGACEALRRSVAGLRGDLRAANLGEGAPAPLAAKIRAALDDEERAARARGETTRGAAWRGAPIRRALPWLVSFAAGVILTIGFQQFGGVVADDRADGELVDAHVRSLMSGRAIEVESSDRHTVKPWFTGKLDFSPWAGDLAADGFPMIGGRLDRLRDRPVAAIVFHSNRHVINLFIARADPPGDADPARGSRRGFHWVRWNVGDFAYAAISDVSAEELDRFVGLVRAAAR